MSYARYSSIHRISLLAVGKGGCLFAVPLPLHEPCNTHETAMLRSSARCQPHIRWPRNAVFSTPPRPTPHMSHDINHQTAPTTLLHSSSTIINPIYAAGEDVRQMDTILNTLLARLGSSRDDKESSEKLDRGRWQLSPNGKGLEREIRFKTFKTTWVRRKPTLSWFRIHGCSMTEDGIEMD